MTMPDAAAHIDPWLVLCERRGHGDRSPCALFLFGFALHHHRLLGLSWIRSSPVQRLDATSGRALTASGSHYSLGRLVRCAADLDLEGRTAWKVLVEGASTPLERRWLGLRKAARWLRVEAPALDEDAVSRFEAEHAARYIAWRVALAAGQGSA